MAGCHTVKELFQGERVTRPKFTFEDFLELLKFARYITRRCSLCQMRKSRSPRLRSRSAAECAPAAVHRPVSTFRRHALKVGENFLKGQVSVLLAQKIDNLNLARSAFLCNKLNPIFHVLMRSAVSNISCHWKKAARQLPTEPTFTFAVAEAGPGSASTRLPAAHLRPGLRLLPEFPGSPHRGTGTNPLSQEPSPPRPGARPCSPSPCHPAASLWRTAILASSHHREPWFWAPVCVCLPEEEDSQSLALRLCGAGDQGGSLRWGSQLCPPRHLAWRNAILGSFCSRKEKNVSVQTGPPAGERAPWMPC
ncbi:uncharacterized protein [Equus caballus]|uniref:uncharacterized protein n=1 Tax=Equus caballus TaxID=9796 RepID=UPI0038B39BD5